MEYRYLRNALSRDPGVEVSCLLFHPGLSKVGGGNRDYISEFPNELEELSKFDVVFLGDVGVDQGQLTEEQCRLLKGLVQQQASGLVFMPGWKGNELTLVDSPLNDLIPVVFDTNQSQGWGSRTPQHFELTELGRRSLLTRLADTQQDNLNVWENLPAFNGMRVSSAQKLAQRFWRCIKKFPTRMADSPFSRQKHTELGKSCLWEPMELGDGGKALRISITTDFGGRWFDGWLINATWPKAKPCGCSTLQNNLLFGRQFS